MKELILIKVNFMNILIIEPIGSGAILVDTAIKMGWNCFLLSYNKSDRILPNYST
jgi:hypothetical protein